MACQHVFFFFYVIKGGLLHGKWWQTRSHNCYAVYIIGDIWLVESQWLTHFGWRGGSVGRASDWRFYEISDPSSNPVRSTRKKLWEFFRVTDVVLTPCRCAQPLCVYARIKMITYARLKILLSVSEFGGFRKDEKPSVHFTDSRTVQ